MYIGSANYSDESQDNIESGTLIRDKSVIKRIFDEVFPVIMDESTPYFEDDFNIFKLFVISMEGKFKKWLTWFDNELTWKNAAVIRGVYEYFKFDVDDLECIHMDIEELLGLRNFIENTYSETDEEYNELIHKITEVMEKIDIEWMSDFTLTDSDFYNFVVYDSDTRTDELIQENPNAHAVYEEESNLTDLVLHDLIDKLNLDISSIENFYGKERKREFYAMRPEDAYSLLECIAKISGIEDRLKKMAPEGHEILDEETAMEVSKEAKRGRFKFGKYGIPVGAVIK